MSSRGNGMQGKIYKVLQARVQADWQGLIKYRLKTALLHNPTEADAWTLNSELILSLRKLFKTVGQSCAMSVIKTWVNAWCTTVRFPDDEARQCIFGCDAEDDTAHYLSCDTLWTIIISTWSSRSEHLNWSPLQKLSLVNPCKDCIVCLAAAFAAYHACRKLPDDDMELILETAFNEAVFICMP